MDRTPIFNAKNGVAKTPRGHAGSHDDQKLFNRFESPVASISVNSRGDTVLGMPERPLVQHQRYAFERQKKADCEGAQEPLGLSPRGKQNLAKEQHLRLVAEREQLHGWDAQQASGIARIQHSRGAHTSPDNPLLLGSLVSLSTLPKSLSDTAAHCARAGASSQNHTGIPASPRDHSRFAGRRAYEAAHNHDLDSPRKVEPHTRQAAAEELTSYRTQQEMRRQKEGELIREFPHGLPPSKLREAQRSGLKVAGFVYQA